MLLHALFLGWTYVVAAIPFGVVITTLWGNETDLRATGSGNIGATNVARTHGWRFAAPVLALDMLKGFVPVLVASLSWPDHGLWWPALVASVAFIGHCWPIFLEFQGGKGVATGAGAVLALTPFATLGAVAVWVTMLAITGKSSVAALVAAISLIGLASWIDPEMIPVVALLCLGICITHTANIRRLLRGEESQVLRPVRWNRAKPNTTVDVLEQSPAGSVGGPSMWRERDEPSDPDEALQATNAPNSLKIADPTDEL